MHAPFVPPAPSAAVARARRAIAAVFFINGAVMGSWAPLIPLVQLKLHLGPAQLGLCLLGMAVGGIAAMPLAGGLVNRFGSAPVVRCSTLGLCGAILLPMAMPDARLLFLALLVVGGVNGVMDVAMNAHGIAVEQALGRPVMSSYHAMYSLGGFTGALGGAALLRATGHPLAEAATVGLSFGAFGLVVLRFLLASTVDQGAPGHAAFVFPKGLAVILGLLCFLVMMAEGSMLDWTAVYLHRVLGADASLAALGFSAFSVAMATGRFAGDWLRQRFGAAALVSSSAVLAAGGLLLAVAVSAIPVAVLGFGFCGLGLSNAVPVLFSAGGNLPGQSAGSGVAAVATLGYAGFLVGPPLIGFSAQLVSLRFGLGLVALGCTVVAVFARRVVGRGG
ncbi:MAG: MFS transporter [Verrucomicrobia bacterium]|nr:MFS transporter [Verrucomicrobiota bacterium]